MAANLKVGKRENPFHSSINYYIYAHSMEYLIITCPKAIIKKMAGKLKICP